MSDYGVFESVATDGHETQVRQAAAVADFDRAVEAVTQQFGTYLGAAANRADFRDRVALCKPDIMATIHAAGIEPVSGVTRRIVGAVRSKVAAHTKQAVYEQYSDEELLATAEQLSKTDPNSPVWPDLYSALSDRGLTSQALERMAMSEDAKELHPKDNWDGYLEERSTSDTDKVKTHNFANHKQAFQSGDYATYRDQYVQIDEMHDGGAAIRYLGGDDVFTVDPSELDPLDEMEASLKRANDDETTTGEPTEPNTLNDGVLDGVKSGDEGKVTDSIDTNTGDGSDSEGKKGSRRKVASGQYGPDSYPTIQDAFEGWLADSGHNSFDQVHGGQVTEFQDIAYDDGWSENELGQVHASSGRSAKRKRADLDLASKSDDDILGMWAFTSSQVDNGSANMSDPAVRELMAELENRGLQGRVSRRKRAGDLSQAAKCPQCQGSGREEFNGQDAPCSFCDGTGYDFHDDNFDRRDLQSRRRTAGSADDDYSNPAYFDDEDDTEVDGSWLDDLHRGSRSLIAEMMGDDMAVSDPTMTDPNADTTEPPMREDGTVARRKRAETTYISPQYDDDHIDDDDDSTPEGFPPKKDSRRKVADVDFERTYDGEWMYRQEDYSVYFIKELPGGRGDGYDVCQVEYLSPTDQDQGTIVGEFDTLGDAMDYVDSVAIGPRIDASRRKQAWQADEHAIYNGEEVQIDEVLDDEVAIRYLGDDSVFTVSPDKLTKTSRRKRTANRYEDEGYQAFQNGEPAAPGASFVVQEAIQSLPVGDPMTAEIMQSWANGYERAREERLQADFPEMYGNDGSLGAPGVDTAPAPPVTSLQAGRRRTAGGIDTVGLAEQFVAENGGMVNFTDAELHAFCDKRGLYETPEEFEDLKTQIGLEGLSHVEGRRKQADYPNLNYRGWSKYPGGTYHEYEDPEGGSDWGTVTQGDGGWNWESSSGGSGTADSAESGMLSVQKHLRGGSRKQAYDWDEDADDRIPDNDVSSLSTMSDENLQALVDGDHEQSPFLSDDEWDAAYTELQSRGPAGASEMYSNRRRKTAAEDGWIDEHGLTLYQPVVIDNDYPAYAEDFVQSMNWVINDEQVIDGNVLLYNNATDEFKQVPVGLVSPA